MAKIYYNMLVAGRITMSDVPERYREAVTLLLVNNNKSAEI